MAAPVSFLQPLPLFLLLVSTQLSYYSASASAVYNIATFGGRSDAQTDSSKAIVSAWSAACGSPTHATIYVPRGRFLVRRVAFTGPCKSSKITFQIDGTLLAPSSYTNTAEWMAFDQVHGVSIVGGTIDGQGASLWSCKSKGHNCPAGARVSKVYPF